MAVTNLRRRVDNGKTMIAQDVIGDGAPASTDLLVTDIKSYPIGTSYYDKTNFKLWIRHAVAGATTDFKGIVLS